MVTNRVPAAHVVAGAKLQEVTQFIEPRILPGPEHLRHQGAGCPEELDHVGTERRRSILSSLSAPCRRRMNSKECRKVTSTRTGRCWLPPRCRGRPKTIVPCKRDSARRLYAALSLLQSSFLFRPSVAYSCATFVNACRLKNCCKRLLEKETSWEVQCSCVATNFHGGRHSIALLKRCRNRQTRALESPYG